MKHYIYKITNLLNNKIYVGKHSTDNIDDGYMGSGVLISRAVNKYGVNNFQKEILFEYDDEESCILMESEIVDDEFISRLDTYNINLGGRGSWHACNSSGKNIYEGHEENWKTIRQMGTDTIKRRWENDDEFREAGKKKLLNASMLYQSVFGNPFKGKKHTDETKKRIGEANSKHQKGSKNSQYGTCWIYSDEERVSKKIDKSELSAWLTAGWCKGRKINF